MDTGMARRTSINSISASNEDAIVVTSDIESDPTNRYVSHRAFGPYGKISKKGSEATSIPLDVKVLSKNDKRKKYGEEPSDKAKPPAPKRLR
ncbi:hypothetical protein LguiA_011872 [Lonicera macranthoides]